MVCRQHWGLRVSTLHGWLSHVLLVILHPALVRAQSNCITTGPDLLKLLAAPPPGADVTVTICKDILLAQTAVIQDSIVLNSNCEARACSVGPASGFPKGQPLIRINIQGSGPTTRLSNLAITGASSTAVVVAAGQSLDLYNVTFANNQAQSGAAIASNGTTGVYNCTFSRNIATSGRGGAIVAQSGSLTIAVSTFSFNSATGEAGAVLVDGAAASIRGNLFDSNSGVQGGAVSIRGADRSAIVGNTFQNNRALGTQYNGRGGAVAALGPIEEGGNRFDNNSAVNSGGALYLAGDYLSCSPSQYISNSATDDPTSSNVYVLQSSFTGDVCPAVPALFTGLSENASSIESCSRCNCSTSLCDPSASCVSSSPVRCTCPSSMQGTGFVCTTLTSGPFNGLLSGPLITPQPVTPPPPTNITAPAPASSPPPPVPPEPPEPPRPPKSFWTTPVGIVVIVVIVLICAVVIVVVILLIRCGIRWRRKRNGGKRPRKGGTQPVPESRMWPYSEEVDVFISHTGAEKELANSLRLAVERVGLKPFFDLSSLQGTLGNDSIMDTAAACAPVGVLLLSPTYFDRSWPLRELVSIAKSGTYLPVWVGESFDQLQELLRQKKPMRLDVTEEEWLQMVAKLEYSTAIVKGNKFADELLDRIVFIALQRCFQVCKSSGSQSALKNTPEFQLFRRRVLKGAREVVELKLRSLPSEDVDKAKRWVKGLRTLGKVSCFS